MRNLQAVVVVVTPTSVIQAPRTLTRVMPAHAIPTVQWATNWTTLKISLTKMYQRTKRRKQTMRMVRARRLVNVILYEVVSSHPIWICGYNRVIGTFCSMQRTVLLNIRFFFQDSENSVPSWASSISLDSQTEEAIVEFMRKFISVLFEDSSTISLDIKSEFGLKTRVITWSIHLQ